MRLYHTVFPLNSPGEVDMHGLVILILTTVVYHHYTVRASGECHPPELGPNTMPVTGTTPTDSRIRINCTKGFLRKAGTSNLFQCKPDQTGEAIWRNVPPLQCIRDPRSPMMTTTPDQHFMPLTSEKTFTPTNPDSTNSWKSWPTTGVSVSVKTSTHCTGNGTPLESPDHYKSTVGGVTGILLLCLAAAGFLLYWRLRHRETNYNGVPLNQINQTNCTSYFPVSVSVIEGCPAEENIADAVNL
ncbi:interleukin-15 receptor subunit alpha isoform X3 [Xyrauchen texanus]|uniref:interleukin-15 receptor subunit alpha isoform X3 n=1 Tax=Xyrauchen texanus TaxID=154827 RepID=UPI002241DE54|nr:interleukin-15 receptor subunit alpha isoform X3 [Xyrauchen texanus]